MIYSSYEIISSARGENTVQQFPTMHLNSLLFLRRSFHNGPALWAVIQWNPMRSRAAILIHSHTATIWASGKTGPCVDIPYEWMRNQGDPMINCFVWVWKHNIGLLVKTSIYANPCILSRINKRGWKKEKKKKRWILWGSRTTTPKWDNYPWDNYPGTTILGKTTLGAFTL